MDLRIGHAGAAIATVPDTSLSTGEARLLLGPSGSGKSTLLMTLAGLIPPVSGDVMLKSIRLNGLTPSGRDRARGRTIGLVFQDIHGVPGLSALDNVLLGAFAMGLPQDRGRARHLLGRTGLADLASRRFETLSRGEAQRVAIARALLLEPALILADEPTASLDDRNTDRIATLLLSMARETGAALMIATHDRRLKAHVDDIVRMDPAA